MKKILVLSVAILIAFSASAQKFGVKAGYGMSGYLINFYSPDGSGMSTGFNAGLVAELDLEVIAVRADVTFNQLGSDYDSRGDSDEDWPLGDFFEYEYKQNINYLNIGVSVKKGFGPAYVFVGPYFGYALQGNQNSIITPVSGDIQEWTDDIFSEPNVDFDLTEPLSDDNNLGGSDDLYNKVDFGANFGLGASFSGIFVEANVGYGFMNFINHDSDYYDINNFTQKDDKTVVITEDAKQNNLFFGLSVGYMFGE
jgi:hypothetical protein